MLSRRAYAYVIVTTLTIYQATLILLDKAITFGICTQLPLVICIYHFLFSRVSPSFNSIVEVIINCGTF